MESQIPNNGPLSILVEAEAFTGVSDNLFYSGRRHLRKCYRIPIDRLHFNIENGRYQTKFQLLKSANPGAVIDQGDPRWHAEIMRLLDGTYEDPRTGVNTRAERSHFEALIEDIKIRGQERPGIVLENGGVMSGNRRLAALLKLYQETNEAKFRYFEAFVVPGEGGMSGADRWRLELSAQSGQGRLLREYDSVERLLKIREGVRLLRDQNPSGGDEAAIRAVATDFGTSVETIKNDLNSLKHVEEYLNGTGRPEEWWRANGLTEVFTEIQPVMDACETNAVPFGDRAKLRSSIFQIIREGEADYRLIRDIRSAVGPARRRRGAAGVPSAMRVLLNGAPSTSDLREQPTARSKSRAREMVERFKSELQAKRQETPLTKAERAETNLQSVRDLLRDDAQSRRSQEALTQVLSRARDLIDESFRFLLPK